MGNRKLVTNVVRRFVKPIGNGLAIRSLRNLSSESSESNAYNNLFESLLKNKNFKLNPNRNEVIFNNDFSEFLHLGTLYPSNADRAFGQEMLRRLRDNYSVDTHKSNVFLDADNTNLKVGSLDLLIPWSFDFPTDIIRTLHDTGNTAGLFNPTNRTSYVVLNKLDYPIDIKLTSHHENNMHGTDNLILQALRDTKFPNTDSNMLDELDYRLQHVDPSLEYESANPYINVLSNMFQGTQPVTPESANWKELRATIGEFTRLIYAMLAKQNNLKSINSYKLLRSLTPAFESFVDSLDPEKMPLMLEGINSYGMDYALQLRNDKTGALLSLFKYLLKSAPIATLIPVLNSGLSISK